MTLREENKKLKDLLLQSLKLSMTHAIESEIPAESGYYWFDIGLKIHNLYPAEPICKEFRELIRL